MPKIKTRRSAAKRFELTGSGKYRRRRQNMRHILTKKAPGRKMRLGKVTLVDSANLKATVVASPAREDIDLTIQENLIVELYSR